MHIIHNESIFYLFLLRKMGKCRENLAVFMLSKPIELTIIILIIIYTLFVFVAIGIEDIIKDDDKAVLSLQIVELIILGLFFI